MADIQRKTANLLDKDNADTQTIYVYTGETTVRYNPNTVSVIFPCQSDTTYTISKTISSRFAVGYTNAYPQNGTPAYSISADDTATSLAITTGANAQYIVIFISYIPSETKTTQEIIDTIMINTGSTALPYAPYWQHSLRKLGTATETIQSGDTIYADGTAATVSLKGNTVQNGTPTPSNPVDVNGVGERTENLWTENYVGISETLIYRAVYVGNSDVTLSSTVGVQGQAAVLFLLAGQVSSGASTANNGVWAGQNRTVTPIGGYVTMAYRAYSLVTPETADTMLNTGSTAKPYEPYGYKIPISSANTTTPIYLGEVQTTRRVKKLVLTGQERWYKSGAYQGSFYLGGVSPEPISLTEQAYCSHAEFTSISTYAKNKFCFNGSPINLNLWIGKSSWTTDDFKAYLAQQYTAGTPVTVWYVLAEPTTGIVNEPLRKIGDYADTVSGITIPTIIGKDTFDVETTLKPSEVSLAYTGWHDATVKEWDGSQWS